MENQNKESQSTSSCNFIPASASSSNELKRNNEALQKEKKNVIKVLIIGGIVLAFVILLCIVTN